MPSLKKKIFFTSLNLWLKATFSITKIWSIIFHKLIKLTQLISAKKSSVITIDFIQKLFSQLNGVTN